MFALILPESPAGERAMGQLLRMTDGTAKVFTFQLGALKADLHAAGYTIRKRSAISHPPLARSVIRAEATSLLENEK